MRRRILLGAGVTLLAAATVFGAAKFKEHNFVEFQTGLGVDTISEKTAAHGVIVDGVTLKDGGITGTATTTLVLPAAGQALTADAATTTNTRTDGIVEVNYASKTNGGSALGIVATHVTGGSGQTVSGIKVGLDADSSNASDVLNGLYIDATDTTATGKANGVVVNGSGLTAAFQANHGYVRIGTGSTPDVTPGDDDLFVEGTIEGDGAVRFDGALDMNNTIDQDASVTGAGAALDVTAAANHATAEMYAIEGKYVQTTTARTSGTTAGVAAKTTSLAGDSGGSYYSFYAEAPTDGGGTATHIGIGLAAGHDTAIQMPNNAATDIQYNNTAATDVFRDNGYLLWNDSVGRAYLKLDSNTPKIELGNATDNPPITQLGTGVVTLPGALYANGGIDRSAAAALTIGGTNANAVTFGQFDVTLPAATNGGNAGAKNEYIGLPRIKLVGLGGGTNGAGAGKTLALMDDTPDGEFAAVDADTTVTADTSYYKTGVKSLGVLFTAAADAGDGATDTGLAYDFSDDESVGFYVYCNGAFASGDLVFILTDNGGAHSIDIPAVTANTWQWVDLTTGITALANGDKDSISAITFGLSAAGAVVVAGRATQCYFDTAYKWDSTEEEALGVAIQQDGVLGVVNAAAGASLVEGTDFIVHYESGSDFIVWITDQSTAFPFALVAY